MPDAMKPAMPIMGMPRNSGGRPECTIRADPIIIAASTIAERLEAACLQGEVHFRSSDGRNDLAIVGRKILQNIDHLGRCLPGDAYRIVTIFDYPDRHGLYEIEKLEIRVQALGNALDGNKGLDQQVEIGGNFHLELRAGGISFHSWRVPGPAT